MKKSSNKKQSSQKIFTLSTYIILILFTIISLSFFYALNSKLNTGFGLLEIIFAIVIAILITSFLIWMNIIISKNKYLGLSVSLFSLVVFVYATSTRYKGPNTTIFLIVFSVIFLATIGYYFMKTHKERYNLKEFDDSL